jgi:hypothetical protein
MYLQTCECFKSAKKLGPANHKSANINPQITKEIGSNPQSCKTYLSFAHLCFIDDFRNKKKIRILPCMMNKTPFEEVQGTL